MIRWKPRLRNELLYWGIYGRFRSLNGSNPNRNFLYLSSWIPDCYNKFFINNCSTTIWPEIITNGNLPWETFADSGQVSMDGPSRTVHYSPGQSWRRTLKIIPMRYCNFSIYDFWRKFSVHVWIPFVHNAPDVFILMTIIKIGNFSCDKTKMVFKADPFKLACDWLTICESLSDWLRASCSKHQFENPPKPASSINTWIR